MGFVIGTAGHIDHGKTALVRALTGQDTDTLLAEKTRGISIDLGFAAFELPDGTRVGLVDVPGHERFIRNMVAGAHGFDLVLFLVAADDGVMPQTEEHFNIIRALGIKRVIFVVSKIDAVEPARLRDVDEEIGLLVSGSPFEAAEILPVDSLSGAGIEPLKLAIARGLKKLRTATDIAPFRLPIDRVFSVQGRGVVVTGTALSGRLEIGDEVTLIPSGETFRVRGLQSHGQDIALGQTGARLAVNLAGADTAAFQRGDVICAATIARESQRFDARLHLSPNVVAPLKNRQKVRLHLGTAERFAHVLILGEAAKIDGGTSAFVQITPDKPLHVMAGDHFVIRDEQGEHTLGGGEVLDALSPQSSRNDARRLDFLDAISNGDMRAALTGFLANYQRLGISGDDLRFRLNLTEKTLASTLKGGDLMRLAGNWIVHKSALEDMHDHIRITLTAFHKTQPTGAGLNASNLRQTVAKRVGTDLFQAVLDHAGTKGSIKLHETVYALTSHQPDLGQTHQQQARNLIEKLAKSPFAPPPLTAEEADKTLISHLIRQGDLMYLANGKLFLTSALRAADQHLEAHFLAHTTITAAEFRDLLGTSRKYALALLETFDRMGRTIRVGDARKRGKPLTAKS